FLFCEISYGLYSYDIRHYYYDEARLGKFLKVSHNCDHIYTKGFGNLNELKLLIDEIKYLAIYFSGDTMEMYILDDKIKPFSRMVLINTITVPITKDPTFQEMFNFIEGLMKFLEIEVDKYN
ncbi:15555_t:CDS:2, partial [Racocetra fulgida]